ncbi:MAG: polyprenyl synthetase family protein [Chloroflexi bacterium]|nr:polyprenyl synthetase family protein [Chloroflexota bacterium]
MLASSANLYGPVQADLARVEDTLLSLARVNYPWLQSLVEHVIKQPGKRLRPAITLLAGSFYRYDLERLTYMAAAELLHTATLVHDDMLDGALRRRGVATPNSMWSAGATVMLGDYLFANSAELVSRTASVRAMQLFAQTLMTVCNGELAQGFAAFDPDITREEYYERIGGKTAALFAMAGETGALLSDAPAEAVEALRDYGWNIGMAFQIVDDILDFTGVESEMGKPVGGDLSHGTLTLPSLLLRERCGDESPIAEMFERRDIDSSLPRIIEMIQNSDIIDRSYDIAAEFTDKAVQALRVLPHGESRATLEHLAGYVLQRRN